MNTYLRRIALLVGVGFRHRSRAGAIGLLAIITLGAAAIVTGRSVQVGGTTALDSIATRANRGDVVLWGTHEALADLVNDPTVESSGEVRGLAAAEIVDNDGVSELLLVSELPTTDERVGRITLRSGTRPAPTDPAGAVVEPGMGTLGSRIQVRRLGRTTEFTVVGVGLDFAGCGYPTCRPGTMFLSPAGFAAIAGDPDASDARVALQLRANAPSPDAVADRMKAAHPRSIWQTRTWPSVRSQLLAPDDFLGGFVNGLGAFLLLGAVIAVVGTVSAQMAARRREMAIISTVGARPIDIAVSIVVEHAMFGLIGSGLGWIIGSLASPMARATVARSIGWGAPTFSPATLLEVTGLVLTLMILATVGAAVRSARRPVVEGLRGDGVHGSPRARWTFRFRGVVAPLGLQDPLTRPVRSFFSFLAVTVAVSGCLAAFGLRSTIGSMASDSQRAGEKWDVTMWSMDPRPSEQLIPLVSDLPHVASVFTSRSDPAQFVGETPAPFEGRFSAVAQGGDMGARPVNLVQGRNVAKIGEAVAGEGFLETFNHRVGDTVEFSVREELLRVHIVGSYRDATNGGRLLRYRLEQIRTLQPEIAVGSVYVLADDPLNRRALLREVQTATGARAQSFASRGIESEVRTVRWILLAVGAFIVLVSLAQLGGAWLVGAREQERDLALLSAIGMTRTQLRRRSGIGAAMVAGISWLSALPLGYLALQVIGRLAVRRVGLGADILRYVAWPSLLLVGAAVIGAASWLGAMSASRVGGQRASLLLRHE